MSCAACAGRLGPWQPGITVCRTCGSQKRDDAAPPSTAHYADYYAAVPPLSPLSGERLTGWARSLLPFRRTNRVLEVGCGVGHFLDAARAEGFEAWGTEISTSAVARLEGRGYRVLVGELPALGLVAGSFDAVVMFEVLEHLDEPLAYLEESKRLLRDGGVLLLTTPNFGSLSRRLLGQRWRVVDPEHRVLFTPRGLRRAFERAGLRPRALSSRNLDPTELLRGFRSRAPLDTETRQERVDALRAGIAARGWSRTAKNVVNAVLDATGTGDTLEAWAER